MRLNRFFAVIVIAGVSSSVSAQPQDEIDNSMLGKVKTVYVREARGLYIEKNLLRKTAGRELWVDARAATELAAAPVGELFKVPAEIAIERGDLVTMRYGDSSAVIWKLVPDENHVTLLVAKYDTLMAMTFGLSNSKPAAGLQTQVQAWYLKR